MQLTVYNKRWYTVLLSERLKCGSSACIKRRYKMKVYADNAATTTISQHALAEMIQYYDGKY